MLKCILIHKNILPSPDNKSQFSDKQNFTEHQNKVSTDVLSNWPFILWLQRRASWAWSFAFLSRVRSTYWYEILHLPLLGNLPKLDDFPLQGVNDVRLTEIHTTEPLVPEPSVFEFGLAIEELKVTNHQALFKSHQNWLQQVVGQFAVRSINLLFLFAIKRNCLRSGRVDCHTYL